MNPVRAARRTVALAMAASCVALLPVAGAAGGERDGAGAQWRETAAPPALAMRDAAAHWTGREFLVLSGFLDRTYPETVDVDRSVPSERVPTALEFDPARGTWRRLADMPSALSVTSAATSAGVTYVLGVSVPPYLVDGERVLLGYDRAANRWARLPTPPGRAPRLVDAGGRLVSVGQSPRARADAGARAVDALFDPAARRWTRLPSDPLGRISSRTAVWAGDRLVLAGGARQRPEADVPSYLHLTSLDLGTRRWTRLASTRLIAFREHEMRAIGSVLVWPETDTGHFGRRRAPTGGTYDLRSGRAARIPAELRARSQTMPNGLVVDGGVTLNGTLFDPASRTWRPLPVPAHPYDLETASAAGGRFLFRYGGARQVRAPFRQWHPVNEAQLLDTTGLPERVGWVASTPLQPAAHTAGAAAAAAHGGFILVAGVDSGGAGGVDPPFQDPWLRLPTAQFYDPHAGTWTRLPDLPIPIDVTSVAATSRGVFVLGRTKSGVFVLQSYSEEHLAWLAGSWRTVPLPPGGDPRLVEVRGELVALDSRGPVPRDAVLDRDTWRWRELPRDPFGAAAARYGVVAGGRLVLASVPLAADGRSEAVRIAELRGLDSGQPPVWKELTRPRLLGRIAPAAFGRTLVWPATGECRLDAERLPCGGTYDVRTGRVARIPARPATTRSGLPDGLAASAGVTLDGALFHPRTGWRGLPTVPYPDDLEPLWAAGGHHLFRYGGLRERVRGHVERPLNGNPVVGPVNEAYTFDTRP